jgi:NADH-quinone oxidoreductase subunit C
MRYDPEKRRVVYEPVSIQPRVLVPRVIRHDSRYEGEVPDLTRGRS